MRMRLSNSCATVQILRPFQNPLQSKTAALGLEHEIRTNSKIECANLPTLSSRNRGWESLLVEQFQHPAGEGKLYYPDDHAICLSLAPRPVPMVQMQDDLIPN